MSQTCKVCAHAVVAASGGTALPPAFAVEHMANVAANPLTVKRIHQVARCVSTLAGICKLNCRLDDKGSSDLLKLVQDAALDIGETSHSEKEMAAQALCGVCTLAGLEKMLERNAGELQQFEPKQNAMHMPCPHCIVKVTRMMLRDPEYIARCSHKPGDLYMRLPANAIVSRVKALSHYTGQQNTDEMYSALLIRPAWSAAMEAAGCVMGGEEVMRKQLQWKSQVLWDTRAYINLDNKTVS